MSFQQTTSQVGAPQGSAGLLRGGPLVAGVEVSLLLSEAHSLKSSIVQTALEDGAVVSDHVILSPVEVTVDFAMSNAGNGADQARDVFSTFKRLRDERTVLELITEHTVYENMVITSVNMTHQAPHKGALNINITLVQLNFVELRVVGRSPTVLGDGHIAKTMARQENGGDVKAQSADSAPPQPAGP